MTCPERLSEDKQQTAWRASVLLELVLAGLTRSILLTAIAVPLHPNIKTDQ